MKRKVTIQEWIAYRHQNGWDSPMLIDARSRCCQSPLEMFFMAAENRIIMACERCERPAASIGLGSVRFNSVFCGHIFAPPFGGPVRQLNLRALLDLHRMRLFFACAECAGRMGEAALTELEIWG